MTKKIKRLIYNIFGLKTYLRILQRAYFFMYHTRLLKKDPNYVYHYFVKNLIKKGDVIIDIGANLGYYSFLFSRWTGKSGKVLSVEPVSIYNEVFNKKAKCRKNVTLYPYALGTEEKTVELVSSPNLGFLSTGLPHVYDPEKDGNIEQQEFRFEAQMKKPSVLFGNLNKINYIKCDIEGFEYVVFSEMQEVLKKYKPIIQVEVWHENEEKLLDLFEELGYTPYKLYKGKLHMFYELVNPPEGDFLFFYITPPSKFLAV